MTVTNRLYSFILLTVLTLGLRSFSQEPLASQQTQSKWESRSTIFEKNQPLWRGALAKSEDVTFVAQKLFQSDSPKSRLEQVNDFFYRGYVRNEGVLICPGQNIFDRDADKKLRLSTTERIMLIRILKQLYDEVTAVRNSYEELLKDSELKSSSNEQTVQRTEDGRLAQTRVELVKLCGEQAVTDFESKLRATQKIESAPHH